MAALTYVVSVAATAIPHDQLVKGVLELGKSVTNFRLVFSPKPVHLLCKLHLSIPLSSPFTVFRPSLWCHSQVTHTHTHTC